MRALPSDSIVLPTKRGGLLVSRSHAVFCGLDREELAAVASWREGESPELPTPIERRLDEHGFFGPPRPARPREHRVSMQLTNACNLRCDYCCTNSLAARGEELDLARWKRVVDEACTAFGGPVRFGVLGGEPLVVPWSLDLAEYVATRKDAHLVFYSNGIGFADPKNAARAAALLRRGFEVRVSLAGVTAERCDRRSGVARFERALAGLREIARHGAVAQVDVMLFPEDVDDVAAHLPELRRALPPGTHMSLGFPYHGGREVGPSVFGSRNALESAFDAIVLRAGEGIPAPERGPLAHRRDGCRCAIGDSLNVRSDGRLFNCFRMEEQVGDLAERGFAETLVALRTKARPIAELEPCARCPLVSLCGGGCRNDNLIFGGNADRPVCGVWRVRAISELLAEDRIDCLEWSLPQLAGEARALALDPPDLSRTLHLSRHLRD